jgi:hypothetical protein
MSKYEFNLKGNGKSTDHEIFKAADEIFEILRVMPTPKDAAPALLYAHLGMMKACFPQERKQEAFAAIDVHCELLKKFLNEGWQ